MALRKMERRALLQVQIVGDIAEIHIGGKCGAIAFIDAADLPLVNEHTWFCSHVQSRHYVTGYPCKTRLHRFLLGLRKGDGTTVVDHINGNGLDNRRANLRIATPSQNLANRLRTRKDSTYRFRGVTQFNSSRYSAYVESNGKRVRINGFATQEEAAMAYNVLARRVHGSFAGLNQVDMG